MKKVKFMLMAIALIAIVGDALAFKASKMYDEPICYSLVPEGERCPECPNPCVNYVELAEPGTEGDLRVCTTTPNIGVEEGNECLVDPNVPNVFKCCGEQIVFITIE